MAGLGAPKAPPKYKPKFQTYAAPGGEYKGTTEGLESYTGYTGPSVQELINQGKIGPNITGYQAPATFKPKFGDYGRAGGSTVTGTSGGEGDYASLIGGDWEVQAAEAAMAARMARARGDYTADIRQAFIDLGLGDVSQVGEYGKAIDAATMKAAASNKYSMTAQIAQAAEKGRAMNNAALAARGILSSGQTTKSQTDVTSAAEKGRYEALRDFLSGALSGKRGLADLQDQLASQVAMARAAAAQRAAELAAYGSPFGRQIINSTGGWQYADEPGVYRPYFNPMLGQAVMGGTFQKPIYQSGGITGLVKKPVKKPVKKYNPPGFIGGK